ncbi:MAG: aminotransferase class V-fold PLP-dependent enzyme [Roseateles sp.]|uniref:aminotransferase class V-fold PLP-dependent enzyme n=1 Tax=Roseateles sp. TaxID=1971397 RepID=UPI0039ECA2A8
MRPPHISDRNSGCKPSTASVRRRRDRGSFRQRIKALKTSGKKPKALLWSSPTYVTGLMLPIAALANLAREHEMLSICDAAHLLGMVEFDFNALNLDYLVTSGSKWQAGANGTGILLMRRGQAAPSMVYKVTGGDQDVASALSKISSSKLPTFQALANSCDVYSEIGRSKISGYTLSLAAYFRKLVASQWGSDRIYGFSETSELSSGLLTFNPFTNPIDVQNEGKAREVVARLRSEHGYTARVVRFQRDSSSAVEWPLRVSTPLWLSPPDLDAFVKAAQAVISTKATSQVF